MSYIGQIAVDTFELPSACLCHYVDDPPTGLRTAGFPETPPIFPQCQGSAKTLQKKSSRSNVISVERLTVSDKSYPPTFNSLIDVHKAALQVQTLFRLFPMIVS